MIKQETPGSIDRTEPNNVFGRLRATRGMVRILHAAGNQDGALRQAGSDLFHQERRGFGVRTVTATDENQHWLVRGQVELSPSKLPLVFAVRLVGFSHTPVGGRT